MDDEFDICHDIDPTVFLKIGQLLCSEEYIYYNGLVFQEDIDRYNRDKEDEETKNKFKNIIIECIAEYNQSKEIKNKLKKKIMEEIYNLENEIEELVNKKYYLIKNTFILEKQKIYEETLIKLNNLKQKMTI